MHLVTYKTGQTQSIGVLDGDSIIDLNYPSLPKTMQALIEADDDVLSQVKHLAAEKKQSLSLQQVKLLAPIPQPRRNIICVGKNYRAHLQEVNSLTTSASEKRDAIPEQPIFFSKATTAVIGPGETIPAYLDNTNSVDIGELQNHVS